MQDETDRLLLIVRVRRAAKADGISRWLSGLSQSLADLTGPPQQLRQLGEVRRHAAGLVAGQPLVDGSPVSAKPLINTSPMRSQFAAVSAIKILLVGVERLILAPQFPQGIASFLTNAVTIFSAGCPHFWQRIRSIVQSAVENFI
jgi:hypothetical protein